MTVTPRSLLRRWRAPSAEDRPDITGILIILFAVLVVAGLLSPAFFNPRNILNVLRQASALGIMSLGQTIVLIAGGIDLSMVSTMQLAGIVAAAISSGRNDLVPLAILVCLLLGAGVGLVNGLLVTRWNVPAFIATLSVSIVTTGVRLVATYGAPPGSVPPLLRLLGHENTGPIPNAILLFAIFAFASWFAMNRTTFGRKVYATGGNRAAAASVVMLYRLWNDLLRPQSLHQVKQAAVVDFLGPPQGFRPGTHGREPVSRPIVGQVGRPHEDGLAAESPCLFRHLRSHRRRRCRRWHNYRQYPG